MRPLEFIRNHADIFARVGSVVATYRTRGQIRFGPYYRLVYRQDRRQRSVYIGRSKQLADQVRDLLKQLQQPRNDRRALQRSRLQRNAQVRRIIREWQELIRSYGLSSHGSEIRGVRAAGFLRIDKGIPRQYSTSRRRPVTVVGHDCIVPSGTTRPTTPAATPTKKGHNLFDGKP